MSAVIAGVEVPDSLVRYIYGEGLTSVEIVAAHDDVPCSLKAPLGTEVVDDDPIRKGRCFELSAVALLEAPRDSTLVHGSIHGPDAGHERIAHAWLKIRRYGLVWEPLSGELWDMEEWYCWSRAWDEVEYTPTDMLRLSRITGHTGPWRDTRYPTKEDAT